MIRKLWNKLVKWLIVSLGFGGGRVRIDTELMCRHLVPDGFGGYKEVLKDRRIRKHQCVTDAYVNFIVDALQAATYINTFKYHDSGTGTGSEVAADTTLGTPCGEARDSGTQVEGTTANVYKSVATHTYAGTFAITEHGLFSASSSGTLMDRTKFSAINVNSGDKIEFTFTITHSSGG
jgi:hypothetical protein